MDSIGRKPDSARLTESLYDLVESLTQRLQNGEPIDIGRVVAEHPEHADRLKQVLPSLQVLADFGSSVEDGSQENSRCGAGEAIPGMLGDFRLLQEIGRGGMGIVYEAEQISLDRKVALKVLPFAGMLDPRHLQRFKNEARAAAGLHHPNIVPVYAVGSDRGMHYYAMQHIEGSTLAEVIGALRVGDQGPGTGAPDGSPSVVGSDSKGSAASTIVAALSADHRRNRRNYFRTLAEWGVRLAEALEYAHSVGVIHRDIKPANLMLDAQGGIWVTDFGLAQIETDAGLTMTGDILGTLRYMSPEQAVGERGLVDARTDVYSLGATLYELLTLRPMFPGADRQDLLNRIASEEPAPPGRVAAELPFDLETIVRKAIEKSSADRYRTAQELADDLRRFLDDHPIRAKRPTLVQRGAKWSRRHTAVVWSAIAILLVATLALSISTGLILRAYQRESDALRNEGMALGKEGHALKIAEQRLMDADRERKRAEEHFEKSREAVDQMLTRVADEKLVRIPGTEPIRRQLLEDALRFYERFLEQRGNDSEIRFETAQAWQRVGLIRHRLGDFSGSAAALKRGIEIAGALPRDSPDEVRVLQLMAEGCRTIGEADLFLDGRLPESEDILGRGLAICLRLQRLLPNDFSHRWLLANFKNLLSAVYGRTGRTGRAIELAREALELERELLVVDPHSTDGRLQTMGGLSSLANLIFVEEFDEADRLFAEAQALGAALVQLDNVRIPGLETTDDPESKLASILINRASIRYYSNRPFSAEHLDDLLRATALLDAFTSRHPDMLYPRRTCALAHVMYARVLVRANRLEEAEPVFRHACRFLVTRYAPLISEPLMEAFEGLAGMLVRQGRRDDKALHDLAREIVAVLENEIQKQSATETAAAIARMWLLVGRIHNALGDADLAKEVVLRALTIDPTGFEPSRAMADLIWATGKYVEALPYLETAVAARPDQWKTRGERGVAYRAAGRFEAALADLNEAERLRPGSWWISADRGRAKLGLGRVDEALDDLDRSIASRQAEWWVFKVRAAERFKRQRFDEALQDIASAVESNVADTSNLTWISPSDVALCPDENFRAGIFVLADTTIERTKGSFGSYLARGTLYAAMRKFDAARQDFESAVAAPGGAGNPRVLKPLADVNNALARRLATPERGESTERQRAVELAEKACVNFPNESSFWSTLGVARYRVGDYGSAREAFRKSMELRPQGDSLDWFFLAMTHRRLGSNDEAQRWYDKAVELMQTKAPGVHELAAIRREAEALLILPTQAE